MIIMKFIFAGFYLYLLDFEHRVFHDYHKFLNLLLNKCKQTNT